MHQSTGEVVPENQYSATTKDKREIDLKQRDNISADLRLDEQPPALSVVKNTDTGGGDSSV